jgi:hypothetical protein
MDVLAGTLIIGVAATAAMDLWGIARKPLFAIPPPDYALLGRWLGHMLRGRVRHDAITTSPPLRGERLAGWAAHYAIGIAFAALLIGLTGVRWIEHPTIGPALLVGVGTVLAPFLVMQPAMGAGIASSRTGNPSAARMQSLVTHAVFGVGLYAGGWAAHFVLAR